VKPAADDNPTQNAPDNITTSSNDFKMSESDPEDKKTGVPSWQRAPAQKPIREEDKSQVDSRTSPATKLEQAKKFLEDDEVKDAPTDKKIAFLESKGVENKDIQELLGISRNGEASNTVIPPEDKQVRPSPPPQINSNSSRFQNHHHLKPPRRLHPLLPRKFNHIARLIHNNPQ
jgi:hypothetical protein